MIISPHSGHSMPGKKTPNIKPQFEQKEIIP